MLEKISQFMDQKLATPMARFAEQKHLRAIRDGIIATLPIIIVSSMFLVVAFLPNQLPTDWGITQFIAKNVGKILLPYRMAMYIMTLYAVFGIGYSLSKSYDLDGVTGGILSELAFMLTILPKSAPAASQAILDLAKTNAELNSYIGSIPGGLMIPMGQLGSAGLFVGILASFFAVEVYRFTQKSNFKISMPPQVPVSVARSFEALTPTFIVLFAVATLTMWVGFDVHSLISKLVAPLIHGTDSLGAVLLICFLGMLFWCFGIHGWSIVGTLARPLWVTMIEANTAAYAAGQPIPHIAAEPFYQWFSTMGPVGLAILLLFFSKSQYYKALGKTSFIPAICNINEPITFGVPIVMNPIMMIPFVATPLILSTIAWFATELGLVSRVVAIAPWTLPGPIGAFLATGGDYRAVILNIFLIFLSVVIYYPFFKKNDENMLKMEQQDQQNA